MDQSEQKQQPVVGVVAGGGQMTYAPSSYQTAPMVVSGALAMPIPYSTQPLANFSNPLTSLPTSKLNTSTINSSCNNNISFKCFGLTNCKLNTDKE